MLKVTLTVKILGVGGPEKDQRLESGWGVKRETRYRTFRGNGMFVLVGVQSRYRMDWGKR